MDKDIDAEVDVDLDLAPDDAVVPLQSGKACNAQAPCEIQEAWRNSGGNADALRVLYYTTHGGTATNFEGVASSVRIGAALDKFNPNQIAPYGMTHARARALVDGGHAAWVCAGYDVVVIADTVPHGRAVLLSLLEADDSPLKCAAKVVVEMTNRFDWDVRDKNAYYTMIRTLVRLSETKLKGSLVWVSNNNVEQAFVESRIRRKFRVPVRVLRPLGISKDYQYPLAEAPSLEKFAAREAYEGNEIYRVLRTKYQKLKMLLVPRAQNYGGPKNLLKFKGFIDFPYQYSVMKFYENIAHGVPQFFPSPRLFESLFEQGLSTPQNDLRWANPNVAKDLAIKRAAKLLSPSRTSQRLSSDFPAWAEFFDIYDPVFEPFVYFFDSLDELVQLQEKTAAEIDFKNVRENGVHFYEVYRESILSGWADVFRQLGWQTGKRMEVR
ncbi:hypothetical protein HDU83_009383 [Entophlyctis luteolus]|nr:hypothetical protein HDU83_009383 [Entophlyctis luteolus]KAJ3390288.1 hypothetical protein HDU84_007669 [Entophlyctis sp. JEL0112]